MTSLSVTQLIVQVILERSHLYSLLHKVKGHNLHIFPIKKSFYSFILLFTAKWCQMHSNTRPWLPSAGMSQDSNHCRNILAFSGFRNHLWTWPNYFSYCCIQTIEFAEQRIPVLNEYCVVCDEPHVFQNGPMLRVSSHSSMSVLI